MSTTDVHWKSCSWGVSHGKNSYWFNVDNSWFFKTGISVNKNKSFSHLCPGSIINHPKMSEYRFSIWTNWRSYRSLHLSHITVSHIDMSSSDLDIVKRNQTPLDLTCMRKAFIVCVLSWQHRTGISERVFSTLIGALIIKASESGTFSGFWRRNAE